MCSPAAPRDAERLLGSGQGLLEVVEPASGLVLLPMDGGEPTAQLADDQVELLQPGAELPVPLFARLEAGLELPCGQRDLADGSPQLLQLLGV